MSLIALLFIAGLAFGYVSYGRFIAGKYNLEAEAVTPAVAINDGGDYVPTAPFYLLGQHFSAISAAGPIAGPILACTQFGWLPCLLWIGLGVVFIGAVHDFSSLIASVRHGGRTVAEIARETMGERAWLAMMVFIWIALIYVIVAFVDITASTFVSGGEDLAGEALAFNPGGAIAAGSVLYLVLAIVMGLVDRWWRPPLWLLTVIFVPATLGAVWLGTQLSTVLVFDALTWALLILAYCFVASLVPVWLLLQPRGYLGGFVLYLALAVGTIGILFGGLEIEQEAFKGWQAGGPTGALFPFLFVTIACGACSGFHGLVCSGTTSKQIRSETDCRPIGYGAMLLEGFVALVALATVMTVDAESTAGRSPGAIYGDGLGRFVTMLIGEEHQRLAATFGAMAFSTFIFDTLDVSTRLGRYVIQELFGWMKRGGAIAATALTIAPAALLIVGSDAGSYRMFWTLFGTANQLLAALTLLAITIWLRRTGRVYWYTALPMVFVMTVTLWSLVLLGSQAFSDWASAGDPSFAALLNGVVAFALLALAIVLLVEAGLSTRRETAASAQPV